MLSNIVNYTDSEDSDIDNDNIDNDLKQSSGIADHHSNPLKNIENDESNGTRRKRKTLQSDETKTKKKAKSLPLPSSIGAMFGGEDDVEQEVADRHQGRKRNFERVEGNWASFVYVPVTESESVALLCKKCRTFLKKTSSEKMHFFELKECHLTLSRTVAVRHYWMDTIYAMLKEKFHLKRSFHFTFNGLQVYTNDNGTRTFISLKVDTSNNLLEAVEAVDSVFEEFKLQKYYENPSFHISIAWCLGDKKQKLEKLIGNELNLSEELFDQVGFQQVEKICVKFGHKVQQIELL